MAQAKAAKPLPYIDNWTRGFWEGCNRGEFLIQECSRCGRKWHPPSPCCPDCLSQEWRWTPASGKGTIFSFIVFHHLYYAGFADDLPYNVCMVELEEGVRTVTNVVGVDNSQLAIGMPVELDFVRRDEQFNIPVFRPAAGPRETTGEGN